jgi:hypothetical protein
MLEQFYKFDVNELCFFDDFDQVFMFIVVNYIWELYTIITVHFAGDVFIFILDVFFRMHQVGESAAFDRWLGWFTIFLWMFVLCICTLDLFNISLYPFSIYIFIIRLHILKPPGIQLKYSIQLNSFLLPIRLSFIINILILLHTLPNMLKLHNRNIVVKIKHWLVMLLVY